MLGRALTPFLAAALLAWPWRAGAQSLAARLEEARKLRCKTALCFEPSNAYAVEPVVDLPVSLVWAAGDGALATYYNSTPTSVEFNAGIRFWFAHDVVSVMVYVARPLLRDGDKIRIRGSRFEHGVSAVRRPFPSLGVGAFGDIVQLGVSYDELRNGSTASTRDPNYPAGAALSHAITFSLSLSPMNLARNAQGSK